MREDENELMIGDKHVFCLYPFSNTIMPLIESSRLYCDIGTGIGTGMPLIKSSSDDDC